MNKKGIVFAAILCFCASLSAFSQVLPYVIFTKDGKKTTFEKMAKTLYNNQVILFGEYHNNAIAHWLQFELVANLHQKKKPLKLGAEMFERDEQTALNMYLEGLYTPAQLDSATGGLWKNFTTDYKPLVDFAKNNKIEFWATNIPRRFASMVYKGGFEALDTLTKEQKAWIAQLPIKFDPTLKGYAEINKMAGGHGGDNLAKAQAIKDATMAETIIRHYSPIGLYIHFNGSYHSNNYDGIYWYLKQAIPSMTIGTIATVTQKNLKKLSPENIGLADFIICVNENMTNTY